MARDPINDDPTLPAVWNDGRQHEDEEDMGSDWLVTQPTIGPAKALRRGKRSAKDVQRSLGIGLAAQLNWRAGRR